MGKQSMWQGVNRQNIQRAHKLNIERANSAIPTWAEDARGPSFKDLRMPKETRNDAQHP